MYLLESLIETDLQICICRVRTTLKITTHIGSEYIASGHIFHLICIRQKKICDGSTDLEKEPTCGRPLGLKFNKRTCELYIADAYYGLVAVGPDGGLARKLVATAEGLPLRFTNALDIDTNTGHVYFTDSSLVFQRRYAHLILFNFTYPYITIIYLFLLFLNLMKCFSHLGMDIKLCFMHF